MASGRYLVTRFWHWRPRVSNASSTTETAGHVQCPAPRGASGCRQSRARTRAHRGWSWRRARSRARPRPSGTLGTSIRFLRDRARSRTAADGRLCGNGGGKERYNKEENSGGLHAWQRDENGEETSVVGQSAILGSIRTSTVNFGPILDPNLHVCAIVCCSPEQWRG